VDSSRPGVATEGGEGFVLSTNPGNPTGVEFAVLGMHWPKLNVVPAGHGMHFFWFLSGTWFGGQKEHTVRGGWLPTTTAMVFSWQTHAVRLAFAVISCGHLTQNTLLPILSITVPGGQSASAAGADSSSAANAATAISGRVVRPRRARAVIIRAADERTTRRAAT
jgi:hypothetical protein